MTDLQIDLMVSSDWEAVRRIYEEGMTTGNATFEVAAPDWKKWDAAHRATCRLVARLDGQIVGWAALTPVSARAVYSGVAEVSVYVDGSTRGRGVGQTLLAKLIEQSEAEGVWTLQSSVFPENTASLKLHERAGFRIVGRRERIACRDGRWRDVLLLERRSDVAGV